MGSLAMLFECCGVLPDSAGGGSYKGICAPSLHTLRQPTVVRNKIKRAFLTGIDNFLGFP